MRVLRIADDAPGWGDVNALVLDWIVAVKRRGSAVYVEPLLGDTVLVREFDSGGVAMSDADHLARARAEREAVALMGEIADALMDTPAPAFQDARP